MWSVARPGFASWVARASSFALASWLGCGAPASSITTTTERHDPGAHPGAPVSLVGSTPSSVVLAASPAASTPPLASPKDAGPEFAIPSAAFSATSGVDFAQSAKTALAALGARAAAMCPAARPATAGALDVSPAAGTAFESDARVVEVGVECNVAKSRQEYDVKEFPTLRGGLPEEGSSAFTFSGLDASEQVSPMWPSVYSDAPNAIDIVVRRKLDARGWVDVRVTVELPALDIPRSLRKDVDVTRAFVKKAMAPFTDGVAQALANSETRCAEIEGGKARAAPSPATDTPLASDARVSDVTAMCVLHGGNAFDLPALRGKPTVTGPIVALGRIGKSVITIVDAPKTGFGQIEIATPTRRGKAVLSIAVKSSALPKR